MTGQHRCHASASCPAGTLRRMTSAHEIAAAYWAAAEARDWD